AYRSPEAQRRKIGVVKSHQVRISFERGKWFRQTCRECRPNMLNKTAEGLRSLGYGIHKNSVERIEHIKSSGKITEGGKGCSLPSISDCVEMIRSATSAGGRIKPGKAEVRRRRSGGPRDERDA